MAMKNRSVSGSIARESSDSVVAIQPVQPVGIMNEIMVGEFLDNTRSGKDDDRQAVALEPNKETQYENRPGIHRSDATE